MIEEHLDVRLSDFLTAREPFLRKPLGKFSIRERIQRGKDEKPAQRGEDQYRQNNSKSLTRIPGQEDHAQCDPGNSQVKPCTGKRKRRLRSKNNDEAPSK